MENNKKNRSLLIGTITYAIGSFGTKILNFLIVPLYTYYILPADLGDYDILVTTVSLLSPLITMKISDAAYRWIIKRKENEIPYISATYKLLIRNCFFSIILILVINFFIPIWNCYYFIAILVGDRVLECLQKLLRGVKNQKLFAASGLVHTSIFVGLNLVKICYFNEGVTALLQSSAISLYLTILIILIFEPRLRKVNFKLKYREKQKEMLKYSIPLVPSALSWWVMNASDRYIIRWVLGSSENGIYSVAYKFPSILQTFFTLFNNAWTDMALAELDKGKESEDYTEKLFEKLYKASFGLAFIFIPLTKLVMQLVLSDLYKSASVYVGFLYLGTVFQGFSSFCSIGYLQGKKTIGAAKTSIFGALVNLSINLICIKFIGLFAASISTFIGFFVMWILRMNDIKDSCPIRVSRFKFLCYLIIGIVFSILTIKTNCFYDLLLTIFASIFFVFTNKELVSKIIGSFIHRVR